MTFSSEEIRRKVIADLNKEYGKDLRDFHKCNELKNKLLKEKNQIIKEVSFYDKFYNQLYHI